MTRIRIVRAIHEGAIPAMHLPRPIPNARARTRSGPSIVEMIFGRVEFQQPARSFGTLRTSAGSDKTRAVRSRQSGCPAI
jgi:hypothetical protein